MFSSPSFHFANWVDGYTLPTPDSSLICDSFSRDGFMYLRTPTKYFMKPNHKRLWKKITKGTFEFEFSVYKTELNRSQAKGLLKYTQGEFNFDSN